MNEHEEIAKALKARLSELRAHHARVERELHKPLPADSEDQAIELENQEALEVIDKTEATEIRQPEANIRGHIWHLRQVRRADRPETPEGAANSCQVHFLFDLICCAGLWCLGRQYRIWFRLKHFRFHPRIQPWAWTSWGRRLEPKATVGDHRKQQIRSFRTCGQDSWTHGHSARADNDIDAASWEFRRPSRIERMRQILAGPERRKPWKKQ